MGMCASEILRYLKSGSLRLASSGDELELIFDRATRSRHVRVSIERRRELSFTLWRQIDFDPMLILPDQDATARVDRTVETVATDDSQGQRLQAHVGARIVNTASQLERRAGA